MIKTFQQPAEIVEDCYADMTLSDIYKAIPAGRLAQEIDLLMNISEVDRVALILSDVKYYLSILECVGDETTRAALAAQCDIYISRIEGNLCISFKLSELDRRVEVFFGDSENIEQETIDSFKNLYEYYRDINSVKTDKRRRDLLAQTSQGGDYQPKEVEKKGVSAVQLSTETCLEDKKKAGYSALPEELKSLEKSLKEGKVKCTEAMLTEQKCHGDESDVLIDIFSRLMPILSADDRRVLLRHISRCCQV